MTSQHGYMLYSVGGVLYGYDFRNGRKPVQLLDFSPAEITQIHGDIHTVAEGNSDCVYVCTYEAGTPDSGRIRKYAVADRRPDRTPGRRKYRLDGIPAHPFAVVQGTVTHTTSDEYE